MNIRYAGAAWFAATLFAFASCSDGKSGNRAPIVFGDTTTIVTEEDQDKLKDMVTDLKPDIPRSVESKDTAVVAKPVTDTVKPPVAVAAVVQPAMNGQGLKAEFKETTVFLPGVNVKMSGNTNLQKANGAVFSLVAGTISGNTLRVSGSITKVSQRYQSVIMLKNELGELPLESLYETTSWVPLTGANGQYRLTGLDGKSLAVPDAKVKEIRTAVQKAAQRRHMSKKKVQEWLASVQDVKSVGQKPFVIGLRAVMWKIDGKDANGKMFSKQVRVDIPM